MRNIQLYLRSSSRLDRALSELVILVAARATDGQYVWTDHEPEAREAGLDPRVIDVVKYRRALEGVPDREAALIALGREAFDRHLVSAATYARAARLFSPRELVSYVSLMLHYGSTSELLNIFNQQVAADRAPLLPIP